MNVVVTGSSGFVGRNLVKKLLEKGFTVYGIDIKTIDINEKKMWYNQENFIQKTGNLCDINDLRNQFHSFKDVEIVFHTVAIQPTNKEMKIQEYLKINLEGLTNLLQVSEEQGIKKYIASSSFSVYGEPCFLPMTEKHPTKPINIYGLSKLLAEQTLEYYVREKEINVVLLRYDGIYGNNQTITGFIEYLKNSFSTNSPVELYNLGQQKRDNVFIDDVVNANILAMKRIEIDRFNIYNIGGNEPKTSSDTAKILQKVIRSESNIILSKKRNQFLGYDTFMDNSKAIKDLGYNPKKLRQNLETMLMEMKNYE